MRLGFDFDGIFVDHPPLVPNALINRLYKKSNRELSYRIPGKLEQKIRIFSHHKIFRHPIQKNLSSFRSIVKKNNLHTFLISGRFGFLRKKTEEWLERYKLKPFFKEIYFNFDNEQPHVFKNEIIRKEKIEKFIDDDIDLLIYLAKENPKVEFFWLHPGNNSRTNLPQNIKMIKNLEEFFTNYL